MNRGLLAVAGLAGAAGVALAAAGAHLPGSGRIALAATMLSLHAPALLALGVAPRRRAFAIAGLILALGLVLFCGDLVLRDLIGRSPLPLAAPTGGTALILGWLVIAAAAFLPARREPIGALRVDRTDAS